MSKIRLFDEASQTLSDSYNEHLGFLRNADSGKTPNCTQMFYSLAITGLKQDLACGKADAALLVAYLQCNGYGCNQNLVKAAEWVEIGAQLGNQACKDLKSGISPGGGNHQAASLYHAFYDNGNSASQVFSRALISDAESYVAAILENRENYHTCTAALTPRYVKECIKHFEDASFGLYVKYEDHESFPSVKCCGSCLDHCIVM